MRLYRVSLRSNAQSHAGYSWHTNMRGAALACVKWKRNDPGDTSDGLEHQARIAIMEVPTTRAALCAFLNKYADHPDNG